MSGVWDAQEAADGGHEEKAISVCTGACLACTRELVFRLRGFYICSPALPEVPAGPRPGLRPPLQPPGALLSPAVPQQHRLAHLVALLAVLDSVPSSSRTTLASSSCSARPLRCPGCCHGILSSAHCLHGDAACSAWLPSDALLLQDMKGVLV